MSILQERLMASLADASLGGGCDAPDSMDLLRRFRKVRIRSRSSDAWPGLLCNRILFPLRRSWHRSDVSQVGGGSDAPDSTSMVFKQELSIELKSGWAQALVYAVISKSPKEVDRGDGLARSDHRVSVFWPLHNF